MASSGGDHGPLHTAAALAPAVLLVIIILAAILARGAAEPASEVRRMRVVGSHELFHLTAILEPHRASALATIEVYERLTLIGGQVI